MNPYYLMISAYVAGAIIGKLLWEMEHNGRLAFGRMASDRLVLMIAITLPIIVGLEKAKVRKVDFLVTEN